ncbi:DinB family protein [Rhodovibrio salinarum]|uniref:Damage-inducible protein DinB n=1 Tax=Rhodovibrio salinarum TaxID=1087 RepID=A0A934QLC5_9PROT|nr:DinB family protein [Rhodovibrio salinarum]MBK1699323.1 damage-inducible protein DinB [Rhodovibrio salinarum]
MLTVDGCRSMAAYNEVANRRLYAACAELSEDDRTRDRGTFFGSIHGTLNHLLVGDRIWMARFQGMTVPSTGLDAILYADFAALRSARTEMDAKIRAFMAGLDDSFLTGTIAYRNNTGRDIRDPVPVLLAHFFNHQTHHRGQVHAMLTQAGHAGPVLDLHRVLEEAGRDS